MPAGECDARPESVVPWSGAEELGAFVAVTTRHGGVSTGPYRSLNLGLHVGDDPGSVVENRRRAAANFGVRLDEVVFAEQVHGAAAAVVGNDDRGRGTTSLAGAVEATDALVTATPGVTLAILVADCVPMALLDPEVRVLAAVHAGWRGTAAGAADAALRAMSRLGARPERTVAFLGPAVHPDRSQVGDEVTRALSPRRDRPFGRPARRTRSLADRPRRGQPAPARRRRARPRPDCGRRCVDGRPRLLQRPRGPTVRTVRPPGPAPPLTAVA